MKHLKCYLLLLILPCLALQCDPDTKDDEQKPTYYMSEEFKDYVLFPEGSWWVYENQYGQLDTVKIIWQEISIKKGKDDYPYNYEWLTHHFKTTYYNDTIIGWGGQRDKGNGFPGLYFRGVKYLNIFPLFFSSKDTGYVLKYNTRLKYLMEKDSLTLNNKTFEQVKIFKNLTQHYKLEPEKIYYAKNFGIIKSELFNGTNWELKSYHINN